MTNGPINQCLTVATVALLHGGCAHYTPHSYPPCSGKQVNLDVPDGNGLPSVDCSPVSLDKGDELKMNVANMGSGHTFLVIMEGDTPFADGKYVVRLTKGSLKQITIAEAATPGAYKYAIIDTVNKQRRPLDPVIVIR